MANQFTYLSVLPTSTPIGVGAGDLGYVQFLNTDWIPAAFVLQNSNGVTFGTSGSVVTASVAAATGGSGGTTNVYNSTVYNSTVYTGGTTNVYNSTVISNPAGVGLATAATQVTWTVNSSGISLNAGAYLTTAQPPGAYLTTQTTNQIATGYATSNVVGNSSGTFNLSSMLLRGIDQLSVGFSNGSIQFEHGGADPLFNRIAASNSTAPAGSTVVFSNANNVSFGITNGSQMTASASYAAQTVQPAVGLNTALTANGVSWTVNSSGLSMNVPAFLTTAQSPGAYLTTAAQVSHSHGNPTLALTNLTGTTASASNGLTISLSAAAPGAAQAFSQYWAVAPWAGGIANAALITNLTATGMTQRPFFMPFQIDGALTADELHWLMSRATGGSNSFTVNIGIYSYSNSTKLNLIASTQNAFVNTDTASVSAMRLFEANLGAGLSQVLTPGQYVLGMAFSATATVAMNYLLAGGATVSAPGETKVLAGSNSFATYTSHNDLLFWGRYTATSNVIPATVGFADVSANVGLRVPLYWTMANHN